jgi:hypothetical protein
MPGFYSSSKKAHLGVVGGVAGGSRCLVRKLRATVVTELEASTRKMWGRRGMRAV